MGDIKSLANKNPLDKFIPGAKLLTLEQHQVWIWSIVESQAIFFSGM